MSNNNRLSNSNSPESLFSAAATITSIRDSMNPARRSICLPSEEYVVQSWKVTPGSSVRAGDKVAVIVRRTTVQAAEDAPPSRSTTAIPTAAETLHKRPKKRRRPGATTMEGSTETTLEHDDSNATTRSTPQQQAHHHENLPESAGGATSNPLLPQQQHQQDAVTLVAPMDGLLRIVNGILQSEESPEGKALIIGYVEECKHPQILMGMCTVCGAAIAAIPSSDSNGNKFDGNSNMMEDSNWNSSTTMMSNSSNTNNNNNADAARSHVTVSGGITMMVSEAEGQQIAQQSAQRLMKQQKLSLVLDLDHTLVHATYDSRARAHLNRSDVRTVVLPMFESLTHPSQRQAWTLHYVKLRPHVKEFFDRVQPMYEIGVYTAGTRLYAEQITMIITRHMVGATMDQPELDTLRHRVAQMEYELRQQQRQQTTKKSAKKADEAEVQKSSISDRAENELVAENAKTATDTASQNPSEEVASKETETKASSSSSSSSSTNGENGADNNQANEAAPASRTRKRVTFDPTENVGEAAAQQQQQQQPLANGHAEMNGPAAVAEQEADDEDVSHRKRVRFGDPSGNSMHNSREDDYDEDGDQNPNDPINDAGRAGTKRRKRVSFGEPPESSQTEPICPQQLEQLREQLTEAERLESAASKLRQQLFGSRIVSRTDVGDLGKDVKSLRRIFPCGGTMAVVVDDREDVWANALDNASGRKGEPPENLLLVRPYHWKPFLGFADVNNAAGADLTASSSTTTTTSGNEGAEADGSSSSNSSNTEDEMDVQLLWTQDILVRLHQIYYSTNLDYSTSLDQQKSVATILNEMRAQVLKRTKLVLSALVPLSKQNRNPSVVAPRPPVVRIAESLGAKLLDNVEPSVTHVVAAKDGTEKILRARRIPTCQVVRASWLMECLWSLTRRDERPHWFSAPSTTKSGSKSSSGNSGTTPQRQLQQQQPQQQQQLLTQRFLPPTTANAKAVVLLPFDPRMESTTSTSSSSSSTDNDDDDEDFAASLENELMES